MNRRDSRKRLFGAAKAAGLKMWTDGKNLCIKSGIVIVIFWPNSITRGDVPLEVCNAMTLKEARKALSLPPL